MNILEQIIQQKRIEIKEKSSNFSQNYLEKYLSKPLPKKSISERIFNQKGKAIIAEFKRKSPSKGYINKDASAAFYARIYEQNNVAGISVLTDEFFFGAEKMDFEKIRMTCELPLLRKDFIIDEYQILESKAMGADAILLIAKILSGKQIEAFTQLAHDVDLEVILEIQNEIELDKYNNQVDIIGINNRNLETFIIDFDNSEKLYNTLPIDKIKIAESGISNSFELLKLSQIGFDGFLIGSEIMRQNKPDLFLKQLIQ